MDYLHSYKEYLKHDRRLSGSTINGYTYCITRFFEFLGRDPVIATSHDIRDMFKYLTNKGIKNSSIATYVSALRSFYNWLHYVNKNEFTTDISFFLNKIVRTTVESPNPQYPTTKEAEQLRECMQAYRTAFGFNKNISEYKRIVRDLAVIEMFMATGARSSELKHVNPEDINLEERTVLIRKGKGSKQRVSIFGDTAKEAVSEYIALWDIQLGKPLFCFTRFNLFYTISKRWAFRSGINPKLYSHSWRHYHITKAQRDGVPPLLVANQVGHENLNTTMRYTHLDHEHRREKYKISDLQK